MAITVIFDMDGVLIDSEPVWRDVEKKFYLQHHGLTLVDDDFDAFTGMPVMVFLRKLHERHRLPAHDLSLVHDVIVGQVAEKIRQQPRPVPGIFDLLDALRLRNILMSVASSSPLRQIDNVLDTLNIRHYFQAAISAETLAHGKPHPEIFLNAAAMMDADPQNCLVIEDSLNGLIAAKAAGMRALALPAPHQRHDPRFTLADQIIDHHDEVLPFILHSW
ncbi:hexitol phosphatase HxpB [Superficieibacter sp. HKU1]|uniref:hexitol phosphatase HxpB n=1 Tax=Superficieibacter sp. HKU1 TaxID=3031919 RepID=UPI0023E2E89B|nr:hexitol phosphatase HxpB [Superficieibacter sp. HKU1]WES68707.1 hexitol phosphatase HxpB [Superficieibacter sp. HKU1]